MTCELAIHVRSPVVYTFSLRALEKMAIDALWTSHVELLLADTTAVVDGWFCRLVCVSSPARAGNLYKRCDNARNRRLISYGRCRGASACVCREWCTSGVIMNILYFLEDIGIHQRYDCSTVMLVLQ
jgi:hypothetical protein